MTHIPTVLMMRFSTSFPYLSAHRLLIEAGANHITYGDVLLVVGAMQRADGRPHIRWPHIMLDKAESAAYNKICTVPEFLNIVRQAYLAEQERRKNTK